MKVRRIVRNSTLYAALETAWRYLQHSRVYAVAGNERALAVLILVVVGVSVARILVADMTAGVKFLSFAVLFLLLVWLARPAVSLSEP